MAALPCRHAAPSAWYLCRAVLVACLGLLAAAPGAPATQLDLPACTPGPFARETLLYRTPPDAGGYRLEVWCRRKFLWSAFNYVFRMARAGEEGRVIGGCFFRKGSSTAWYDRDERANRFTSARWLTTESAEAGAAWYELRYDVRARKLRITKVIGGRTSTLLVDAPRTVDELDDLLFGAPTDAPQSVWGNM
ncbi:MAG: hypothetical protein HYY96_02595 [Candidatus Tectomicrobia bacterium]|nr:hypothetical protein [Candidatus Tectomicrobia bacterium]